MKHQTKPTVMILGSPHLANPGADVYNTKIDDVLTPKRQDEISELVRLIKAYQPTKIALEQDEKTHGAEIQRNYQGYLKGTYELKRWEVDQIGFRLAKQMGHSKVYCVDYLPKQNPFFTDDFDWDLIDYPKFAETHDQKHLLPFGPTEGKITKDEKGATWIESEKYAPIIDMYIQSNEPAGLRKSRQFYLRIARIGLDNQYPGANWLAHDWYARNLKIFVNLTRITESADDRIILIIGDGHVYLVQQFLEESGDYIVESPLKYLKTEDAN